MRKETWKKEGRRKRRWRRRMKGEGNGREMKKNGRRMEEKEGRKEIVITEEIRLREKEEGEKTEKGRVEEERGRGQIRGEENEMEDGRKEREGNGRETKKEK